MRILFMGTPDFAEESLKKLFNSEHEIIGVVTNPDRAKGRGMKTQFSEVKEFAIRNNIHRIYQPEVVKDNSDFIEKIKKLNPDIICVVAYGKILPKEILNIPKYGCINLHGSILPKYRGAAPIQWSVLNGDTETGVTTIYMNEKMDAGDIILKEKVQIEEYETTGELWDKLAKIGADLLLKTVNEIQNGTAKRIKQSENFTVAPMINREISRIDWNNEASKIKNLVYGLNPFMGAYTMYENKKIKIWKIKILDEMSEKKPGVIVYADEKRGLIISTKDKNIIVEELQGENSKKMKTEDFLRGNKLEVEKTLM